MPKITELFAYVVADKSADDEGVPGVVTRAGTMPLMGADMARAEALRPIAQDLATTMGKPVRLLRFTCMEEVAVFQPEKP
jgi:hypothetical protein